MRTKFCVGDSALSTWGFLRVAKSFWILMRANCHHLNRSKSWIKSKTGNSLLYRRAYVSRSLIESVGSDGSVFATILKGNNNSETFCYFLHLLIKKLDSMSQTWRDNYILLLDNAPPHTSKLTQNFMTILNVPRCFTAPASYKILPVEMMFARLKPDKIVIGALQPSQ